MSSFMAPKVLLFTGFKLLNRCFAWARFEVLVFLRKVPVLLSDSSPSALLFYCPKMDWPEFLEYTDKSSAYHIRTRDVVFSRRIISIYLHCVNIAYSNDLCMYNLQNICTY